MRTLTWLLLLPLCLSCGYALTFPSLRDTVRAPQGKVSCGEHLRIKQNVPEHAQGWLGSKWLWLFVVAVMYVIVKFPGVGEKCKVQSPPPGLRGCPVHPPLKKNQGAASRKDQAFSTLTQLETDLVNFVYRVQDLKAAMTAGGKARPLNLEVPTQRHHNVTIYEVWGEEDDE